MPKGHKSSPPPNKMPASPGDCREALQWFVDSYQLYQTSTRGLFLTDVGADQAAAIDAAISNLQSRGVNPLVLEGPSVYAQAESLWNEAVTQSKFGRPVASRFELETSAADLIILKDFEAPETAHHLWYLFHHLFYPRALYGKHLVLCSPLSEEDLNTYGSSCDDVEFSGRKITWQKLAWLIKATCIDLPLFAQLKEEGLKPMLASEYELFKALKERGFEMNPLQVLGDYMLDIAIATKEKKLNIEVDVFASLDSGGSNSNTVEAKRNLLLLSDDWQILRFHTTEIFGDVGACVDAAEEVWKQGRKKTPAGRLLTGHAKPVIPELPVDDDIQRLAITHGAGPMAIEGGAGTGKSSCLGYRIGFLLGHGVSPEKILVLSHSPETAKIVKTKVESLVDRQVAQRVAYLSYHDIGLKILKENLPAIKRRAPLKVESNPQKVISRILAKCKKDLDPLSLELSEELDEFAISSLISLYKANLVSAKHLKTKTKTNIEELVARVFQGYEDQLQKANRVDRDDMISLAAEVLLDNADVRQKYQHAYDYIICDEYQDVTSAGDTLARLLAQPQDNICFAGDEDEAIYENKGGLPRLIADMSLRLPNSRCYLLEKNWRSHPTIVDHARSLAAGLGRRRIHKDMMPGWGAAPAMSVVGPHMLLNETEEAEWVAEEISLLIDGGRPPQDIAVLYRYHRYGIIIEQALSQKSIKCVTSHPEAGLIPDEVGDVMAFLRLIMDPDGPKARESFERVCQLRVKEVDPKLSAEISAFAEANNLSYLKAVEIYSEAVGAGAQACADLKQLVRMIRAMNLENKSPADTISTLRRTQRLNEFYKSIKTPPGVIYEPLQKLSRLEEDAKNYRTVAEFVKAQTPSSKPNAQAAGPERVVQILTLHEAKGKEFPIVFMVGLAEGLFPADTAADREEERRLCYVGMTRARELLYVSYPATFNNVALEPSSFLVDGRFMHPNAAQALAAQAQALHAQMLHRAQQAAANVAKATPPPPRKVVEPPAPAVPPPVQPAQQQQLVAQQPPPAQQPVSRQQAPVQQPPMAPAASSQMQQAPMQQAPMQQQPAMQQAPMQQAPMQQPPMQQAPMQQAPMQQAPMQQPPMQQPPMQQPPMQQPPMQQAPMQQAPMQPPPVQQAPQRPPRSIPVEVPQQSPQPVQPQHPINFDVQSPHKEGDQQTNPQQQPANIVPKQTAPNSPAQSSATTVQPSEASSAGPSPTPSTAPPQPVQAKQVTQPTEPAQTVQAPPAAQMSQAAQTAQPAQTASASQQVQSAHTTSEALPAVPKQGDRSIPQNSPSSESAVTAPAQAPPEQEKLVADATGIKYQPDLSSLAIPKVAGQEEAPAAPIGRPIRKSGGKRGALPRKKYTAADFNLANVVYLADFVSDEAKGALRLAVAQAFNGNAIIKAVTASEQIAEQRRLITARNVATEASKVEPSDPVSTTANQPELAAPVPEAAAIQSEIKPSEAEAASIQSEIKPPEAEAVPPTDREPALPVAEDTKVESKPARPQRRIPGERAAAKSGESSLDDMLRMASEATKAETAESAETSTESEQQSGRDQANVKIHGLDELLTTDVSGGAFESGLTESIHISGSADAPPLVELPLQARPPLAGKGPPSRRRTAQSQAPAAGVDESLSSQEPHEASEADESKFEQQFETAANVEQPPANQQAPADSGTVNTGTPAKTQGYDDLSDLGISPLPTPVEGSAGRPKREKFRVRKTREEEQEIEPVDLDKLDFGQPGGSHVPVQPAQPSQPPQPAVAQFLQPLPVHQPAQHQPMQQQLPAAGSQAGVIACPQCGEELEANARFCGECGYLLGPGAQSAQQHDLYQEPTPYQQQKNSYEQQYAQQPQYPQQTQYAQYPQPQQAEPYQQQQVDPSYQQYQQYQMPAYPQPPQYAGGHAVIPSCHLCGTPLEEGAKFCGECGSAMVGPQAGPSGYDPSNTNYPQQENQKPTQRGWMDKFRKFID